MFLILASYCDSWYCLGKLAIFDRDVSPAAFNAGYLNIEFTATQGVPVGLTPLATLLVDNTVWLLATIRLMSPMVFPSLASLPTQRVRLPFNSCNP